MDMIFSTVQAGFPSPADDFADSSLSLDALLVPSPATSFMVRVSGDSMTDAGILAGDILVVNRGLQAVDHDIVVAIVDNEFTCKRLRFDRHGKPWLMAEGKSMRGPLQLPSAEEWSIWGVVVSSARRFK